MTQYPKISIVTPVFNRVNFIEETILSVINQGYPNLEYIIIDGCSTDGTTDVIKKYSKHLKFWISERDNGMYDAINKGFKKSTGEIMAWINSDDKYHAGSLFTVASIFIDLPEVKWLRGLPTVFNQQGICVKASFSRPWSIERFLLNDYQWIQQESVFWRRSLWDVTGGMLDINYTLAADFELWCRFFQKEKLFIVNAPLAGFRLHGDQLSKQYPQKYEEEAKRAVSTIKVKRSFRFHKIKFFWFVYLLLKKVPVIRLFKGVLIALVDKLMCFPPAIFYSFTYKKWYLKQKR